MGIEAYNDNAIQYGTKVEAIKRGPTRSGASTVIASTVLENLTINRPVKEIDRADEIGGPNGWAAVNAQVDGNCVVQMGAAGTNWPHNGDWFEDTLDAAYGLERFVLLNMGTPYEQNGYYKVNAKLKKANFPS